MDPTSAPPRKRQLVAARARLASAHAGGHLSDAAHEAATQSLNGVQSVAELEGLLAYFERGASPDPTRQVVPAHEPERDFHSSLPATGVAEVARRGRPLLPGRLLAIAVMATCLVAIGPRDALDEIRGGIEAITDKVGPTSADPLTAAGFEVWRDRVVAETGSSKVVDATLHDTYAVATVEIPDDPGMTRAYLFDGDWEMLRDDEPRTSSGPLIDLADFDPQILDELIENARTRLDIANPSETAVIFGTQVTTTSGTGRATRTRGRSIVQVSLVSESRSGSVSTGLDGSALETGIIL